MKLLLSTLVSLVAAASVDAQDMAGLIAAAPDGRVRMTYEAREGVCGNGRNVNFHFHDSDDDDWDWDCEPGPVRVLLRIRAGEVNAIDTYIGGRWRNTRGAVTDLGEVDPAEASAYFLSLARDAGFREADEAIFPAIVAAGVVVWPDLLELARDRTLDQDVRSQAIFWLGQEAADEATSGLERILDDDDEDIRLREHAVFAISQRDDDVSIPILLRVATTNRYPQIREQAFFWLADSEDPRVLDFFEGILTAR